MAVKPPSDKNARRSKRFESNDKDKTEVSQFYFVYFGVFLYLNVIMSLFSHKYKY